MEERTGEAYELDEQLTVVGKRLRPGERAPDFALDSFNGAAMRTVRLADSAGSVRLLTVINSLDTPVCHVETHRWEGLRADLPENVRVYTVSMDLPFAQARWQGAEHVAHAEYVADQMREPDYAAAIAAARHAAGEAV
jgi:thiol peroxidase